MLISVRNILTKHYVFKRPFMFKVDICDLTLVGDGIDLKLGFGLVKV